MLNATGVILAGGKSVRMGVNKALLKIGKLQMVQHIANELLGVFPEVIISSNDQALGLSLGLPVVPDRFDNKVPLCGIHAALCVSKFECIHVVACDMPFVTGKLAQMMLGETTGYDAAVPRHGMRLEPLFAVYRKSCLQAVERCLLEGNNKTDSFYKAVNVNYVDMKKLLGVDEKDIFFNVNTPSDLNKARKIAGLSSLLQ